VRRRRSREHRAVVGGQGVVRRDHVGADPDQDVDDDDGGADRAQRALATELYDDGSQPRRPVVSGISAAASAGRPIAITGT